MVIQLELNQLQEILGNDIKPDTTFLSDINKENVINIETQDNKENQQIETKIYKCSKCSYETPKLTELMLHSRREHPKPKKLKEEVDNNTEVIETMPEETDLVPQIGMVSPVETEEAKSKKDSKKKDVTAVLTLYDRLESLLKGYQVRGIQGIIQSSNMYDIGSISFIPVLKDLLRNTSTSPGLIGNIADAWSQIVGIKSEQESISHIGQSKQPSGANDALDLMSKLRTEEINDSIIENYKSKLEDKKLDMEIKRKRLSGDFMENKNSPDISKIIELEMLKYQMMNQKPNPELEMLKLQMMQPKTNPDMDMIKSELSKLQLQLATPKTDGQVELLKQQIDSQNRKFEELQRKSDEDAKLTLLREEARRDREALEKRLEEQSKQTQELIKSMQVANAPKSEDILRSQLTEMQRQNDLKLQEMQKQFNQVYELKRDEENRRTIETLKEEIKSVKENSGGQIAQVADSMKDFATNITHAFEKKELNDQHTKETEELKKKISDVEHNKSLTNEQYVMEKTTKLAEEGFKAIGGALDGFGKALQPATQRAAESSNTFERAKLALDLKQQGFNEQTIASVLNQPSVRTSVPSARSEFEQLAKMTEQLEKRNDIPPNIQPSETMSEPQVEQIKFATSPEER